MLSPQRRQNSRVFTGLGVPRLENTTEEQRNGLKNYPTSLYLDDRSRATSQRLYLLVEAIGLRGRQGTSVLVPL